MPIYDYRCSTGHEFEALAPMDRSAVFDCVVCGAVSAKIPSRVHLSGSADAGIPSTSMPQTWRGTNEGNAERISQLRRQWAQRRGLEEKYEELRGDRRPILAHEGRYSRSPLRLGDHVPGKSSERCAIEDPTSLPTVVAPPPGEPQ